MQPSELRERLARIEENLKEHMRRSDLLEKRQDENRTMVQQTVAVVQKIETRNSLIFAMGAGLLPLASLIAQLWKIFH
jgi:hypothetical protein